MLILDINANIMFHHVVHTLNFGVGCVLKIIFIMKVKMSTSSPILYTELIIIHAELEVKIWFYAGVNLLPL